MKKLFLSMILMVLPLLVSAYDVEVDGIYYNLKSGNRAEVTYQFYYSGYSPSYYSPYNTTEVTIPEKFTFNGTEYTVTSIGQYAFYECRNLNYVTIPNSVISIGQYAFYKCTGLTSVTIPNSLTIIEPNAFWDCVSLTSVHITDLEAWCKIAFYTYDSNPLIYSHHLYLKGKEIRDLVIPNTISYIQRYSFSGCTGMTSVTIPNSVISIRDGAFFKCTGLTSVTIPNSVNSIGNETFAGCSSLFSVISKMETPCGISSNCFPDDVFYNTTLYVPKGTKDKYKSTDYWSKFVYIEEGEPESTQPDEKKCATPNISYADKKLTFSCATEGAQCLYTITDSDIKTELANEVSLTATYNISVYATKSGYTNSDVATATLVWTDAIFTETTEPATSAKAVQESIPVLISAKGGNISVRCEADGQEVNVYTIDGLSLGSATVKNGEALISTSIPSGDIAVVKVGGRSVKVIMR